MTSASSYNKLPQNIFSPNPAIAYRCSSLEAYTTTCAGIAEQSVTNWK